MVWRMLGIFSLIEKDKANVKHRAGILKAIDSQKCTEESLGDLPNLKELDSSIVGRVEDGLIPNLSEHNLIV